MKALERMEEIAPAHVDSPFDFRFREFSQTPDPLLSLENIAAGYGDERVLDKVQLVIRAGDRIGLLGKNGAGKSTLIKLLAGELKAKSGERREGKGLAVGYFAQHQLEHLRLDESPLQHLVRLDGKTREQELRNFLGGFNFHGDQALAPIAPFSGGEKARLALALLIWQRPNLLLLDEPTNHLDLDMRHALNLALQEYDGAIVVVSHDRHLLKTTTELLLLVANGAVTEFEGDLDDYRNWLNQAEAKSDAAETPTLSVAATDRRDQKRQQAEARNARSVQRRPLENAVRALEREIDKLHAEKTRLDGLLATGALYTDDRREDLKLTLRQQAEVGAKLSELEEEWLLRQTELEML
jgi:ATP-binding cassette, subfamily F, member 3